MQHPPFLKPGAVIGITCPSSAVTEERVERAVNLLKEWGYKTKTGNTIGLTDTYFSGDDDTRLADLQSMLDDDSIDAILMGRGGYGMSRIIDRLDFTKFLQKPKWICGFSDIIVLQSHLQKQFNMPSIHGPMCGAYKAEAALSDHMLSMKKAWVGEPLKYQIAASSYNRPGSAAATLTGGNLAILTHLTGTVSECDFDGKILLIEDIGEHLYHIDRMMLNLKRNGKLDRLKGLLVGSFNEIEDTDRPFGQTLEQIIIDKVKEYDYPVCFNFPCGHEEVNYAVFLGMNYRLTVGDNGSTLETMF